MTRTEPWVQTEFRAIGTTNRILATDLTVLTEATTIAREHLDALDRAVSRFRADSEVCRLAARAALGPASADASPTFAAALRAALHAARITDGLVDPTVGSAMVANGYDADLDAVRDRPAFYRSRLADVPGWANVAIDESDRVTVPAGCLIDLGATAKAFAADTIAGMLADRLPGGFLVNLGGDIAVSGRLPEGGWRVGVQTAEGVVGQVVTTTGQGLATSSTRLRTWATDPGQSRAHHIVDPRTGRTAPSTWSQVSCAGACALEANAASTAAIVLGPDAPAWLQAHGIPARLDGTDGGVTLTGGWPAPQI
jgi:thiamine biosynthesis lipoprotein